MTNCKIFISATIASCLLIISCDNKNQSKTPRENQSTSLVSSSSVLGTDQNDAAGFNSLPWGQPLNAFRGGKLFESSSNPIPYQIKEDFDKYLLAAILKVPQVDRSYGLITWKAPDWSRIPCEFETVRKDDTLFIYFKKQLAMGLEEVKANQYDAIFNDFRNHNAEFETIHSEWNEQNVEESPDRNELNAILFKRGNSNTRLYLIQLVFHASAGFRTTSVFTLLMPNSVYQEIQADIGTGQTYGPSGRATETIKPSAPDTLPTQTDFASEKPVVLERFHQWLKDLQRPGANLSDYYADSLRYYKQSHFTRAQVLSDKASFYRKFQAIRLDIQEPAMGFSNSDVCEIAYEKEYTLTPKDGSGNKTGTVLSHVTFARQRGRWLLTAEWDQRIPGRS